MVLALVCGGLLYPLMSAPAQAADAPFGLHKRPMPAGTDLNLLLPATLGPFKRDALPAGAKLSSTEDVTVSYRSGGDTIDVGASRAESVNDAREAIKVTREEAVASKISTRGEKLSLKSDPAYFHVGDFIAWTRGPYFFYAKANSPDALARFMAVYPY
jgi:hypothetical protein